MSFDALGTATTTEQAVSQSLSSRAMSFDAKSVGHNDLTSAVSIPFEQGDVFRPVKTTALRKKMGLNPFRAGRCLSTSAKIGIKSG